MLIKIPHSKIFYPVALMFLPLFFCTKKQGLESSPPLPENNIDTAFHTSIKDCPCTVPRADSNRLEMTIHGKKLCFNRKIRNSAPAYLDQWQTSARNVIYMDYWYNADSNMMVNMQYNNPAFLKHGMPYMLNYLTQDSCEVVGINLYNFYAYHSCNCDVDDGRYYSYFFDPSFEFVVLSFQNNILEARFQGDFFTITGKRRYKVTDGYLKVKLQIENNMLPQY